MEQNEQLLRYFADGAHTSRNHYSRHVSDLLFELTGILLEEQCNFPSELSYKRLHDVRDPSTTRVDLKKRLPLYACFMDVTTSLWR